MNQHHPEFTQSSYNRLRSLEDAFKISNYLQNVPKKGQQGSKQSISQKIQSTFNKRMNQDNQITAYDRSYGIQKIFDLHQKKEYKKETLFIAAGILDRYIHMVGPQNFPKAQMVSLATICVLMSAKLEQPISPSFTRMINLLTDEEKRYVSKHSLIELEAQILAKLGFDFNFPGPMQSMERHLRVLNYQKNKTIHDMGFQICKFQLNDARFLNYQPSMIAACSVILAINIFEKDKEQYESTSFFSNCKVGADGLQELNLDIWNNSHVHQTTGYSINDIRQCLVELSQFICNNLSPNRLEGFDIQAIMTVQQYKI